MNLMRTLTFAAVAGVATASEVSHGWAPAMAARDECSALPALCTGPVMLSGVDMMLTYICPKTTTTEAWTTVHVTVTATTTVTEAPQSSAPVPAPTSAPAPPSATPHGPDEPMSTSKEITTTITVHSTTKLTKTLTVTHKTGSTSFPSAPIATTMSSSFSAILPVPFSSSATFTQPPMFISTGSIPLPVTSIISKSLSGSAEVSSSVFATPVPSQPLHSPPFLNVTSSSTLCNSSLPTFSLVSSSGNITNATVTTSGNVSTTAFTGFFSVTAITGQPSVSLNATASRSYQFPSLRVRDGTPSTHAASSTSGALKATKTGAAIQKSVSIAALVFGFAMAAYFG